MLELYNTTNDVKRIPKYKYNGKFVIPPHGSVRIEDEQAYFFKPYARIGIVVRKLPEEVAAHSPVVQEEVETVEPVEEIVEPDTVEQVVQVGHDEDAGEMEEFVIDDSNVADEMVEIGSLVLDEEEEVQEEVTEEVTEEETEEVVEEITEEAEPEQTKKYTAEDLVGMTIGQLRNVAKELGLDIYGIRKKEVIRGKILESLE